MNFSEFQETPFFKKNCLLVSKEKLTANGDYNLSGERYRESGNAQTTFPFVPIKEIALEIKAGFASGQSSIDTKGVPHIRPMNITEKGEFIWDGVKRISDAEFVGKEDYVLKPGDILFNNTNSKELVGKTCLIEEPIYGGYQKEIMNHELQIKNCREKITNVINKVWGSDEG